MGVKRCDRPGCKGRGTVKMKNKDGSKTLVVCQKDVAWAHRELYGETMLERMLRPSPEKFK